MTLPLQLWLEPLSPGTDLEEGLRARVADPAWFLARQWQLGEHQGEDASSPVAVSVSVRHEPIRYDPRRPHLDPTVVPAEALIEAEPGDWWTIGRRIRLGRQVAPRLPALTPARLRALRFAGLPAAYADFVGEIDGRAVFAAGLLAGDPVWAEVPSPAADNWSRRALTHRARFAAGSRRLDVADHPGGDADWFSVDGGGTIPAAAAAAVRRTVLPGRLDYPGAPNPRWWQFEDHQVDIGGFAPDRSHLGTALLLDVALAHADDWFWIPVPQPSGTAAAAPASSGVLVTLAGASVRDSFDQDWPLQPPPIDGPGAWSLFAISGLDATALVVWPVAVAPQAGPLLDDIALGVDEDANLAWAVELRADGTTFLANPSSEAAAGETARTGSRAFRYLPSTTLPPGWHPYRRTEGGGLAGSWQQGIVADLTGPLPRPRPGPRSAMIGGPSGPGAGRGHEIDGHAIPSSGVALRRRAMLARDTGGRPVLWVERSAHPILGPPTSHLRFDVLAENPEPITGGSDG